MGMVLYDGDCGLCQASIGWVARHLSGPPIAFVPRESAEGRKLLDALETDRIADSLVFVDGSMALLRSDAVPAILARCRLPWRLGTVGRFVPRPWRDSLYDLIAHNRHRLFGKRACTVNP